MGSNEMKVIPTINFSKNDLRPGTTEWESTKTQVFQALQKYSCFKAIYENVSRKTREAIVDTSKQIFEFPLEKKLKNSSTKLFDGFEQHPHFEILSISNFLREPENVETFANNFWPEGNPDFRNAFKSFSMPVVELDEMIRRMVLESLGLNNYIDEFLDANIFNSRFIHYKAAQGEDGNKRQIDHGHTDASFLTIISENSVNGLQVLPKNGEWIDFNIAPNSFAVLLGDSFMAWTNGRLRSVIHRVKLPRDSDRFSFPLFSMPKSGWTVEAPKELVDEEHPLLFKPYDIDGLFEFLVSEAGYAAAATKAFKAYCGI